MPTKKRGKASDFTEEQLALLRDAADELAALQKMRTQKEMGLALGIEQQTAGRFWKKGGAIGVTTANRLVQHLGYKHAYDYFEKRLGDRAAKDLQQFDPRLIGGLSPEQHEAMRWARLPALNVPMEMIRRVNDFYGTIKRKPSWWLEQYLHAKNETEPAAPAKEVESVPASARTIEEPRRRRRAR